MNLRLETFISLAVESRPGYRVATRWADKTWDKLIIYMALLLGLFLLLILFFVIFTSWWRRLTRESPRNSSAYTLEELAEMRKKKVVTEAEYKKLRQKTLEEMELTRSQSPDS